MFDERKRIAASCLIVFLVAVSPIRGGQEQKQQEKPESVTIGAAEVIVDVIVTDKKDRAIPDLGPADFEVYEDGIKQEIRSVRFEQHGSGLEAVETDGRTPTTTPGPSTATPVARMPNLIALVFDNLSLARASQVYAARAAHDYLDHLSPNDWVAVFGIDTRLFLAQTFTRDREALKRAVNTVANGTSRQFASSSDAIERLLQSGALEGMSPEARLAAAETYQPSPNDNPAAAIDAVLLRSFRAFENLEQDAQARATILGLLSLIRGQQILPGRKTLIFFSEGFSIPSSVNTQFKSVIGNANRANVAFYTIDAGGLRVESEAQRASRELSVIAEARSRGADPTLVQGGESMLGRAESIGRMNRESVLRELADETGGLSIYNTNDLRSGLERIDQDMRSYYVLTYTPTNQEFDGQFRRISVKINRPDVRVRARSGYFALRTADSAPVLPHEEPLFDVLRQSNTPTDFPIKLASMQFPMPLPRLTNSLQVVMEVCMADIAFTEAESSDKKDKNKEESVIYAGQLAVMALVKNEQGMVVRKLSQNYSLTARADRLEALKKNTLVFYRNTDVDPGRYRIETVVRDGTTGKASVSQTSATVPMDSSAPLRISSVVPINGAENLKPGERSASNPFHYGNVAVMPNLTKTYKKSPSQKLMFYFAVQTAPTASVNVKIEFMQAGQVLAQSSGGLPAPDQTGRIQFIAEFPSTPFPSGTYDVRMTVTDGTNQAAEQTSFTVVD